MPRPSRDQPFDASEICVVHAVQRCVCRAWLAGVDPATGKDSSFRKEWIRQRLEALASGGDDNTGSNCWMAPFC